MQKKGTINSVSGPRDFNGTMQIGFTLKDEPAKWYNIPGEEEVLNELKKKVIQRGAEISFEDDGKTITELKLESPPKENKEGNWADEMTNFKDLLSAAHEKFKDGFNIRTNMKSVDFEKKTALFKARVTVFPGKDMLKPQHFEAHGDATSDNVKSELIRPHFIRMAETRAIARALRWATNNAKVAQEETSDGELPEEKGENGNSTGTN